ncbi:MAG: EamA family transporter RarD, partial [Candidatus Marinimicrobia bacterium]|nr:EamA family transporter RarD [Candidatus Neomarinimicrobiota bacterium]
VYIWAVNSGFIVDSSLGYFVNPLFTVFLGVVVLKEKPRPWQWVSIGIAGGGVLYLTLIYGSFPWIALVLAFTFGMYGLIRKTAPLGSMAGLTIETAYMLLPALVFLLYLHWTGQGAFGNVSPAATVLLAGAGIVTAVPLLFFAKGARQIPLTTIGLLHYIAPTLQFLLGVFLYGEVVASSRLVGFVLVWLALIIFSVDSVISTNRRNAKPVSTI